MNPTTRRYSRSLAEAFPSDYAASIERPPRRLRLLDLAAYAVAVVLAVVALAIKFAS